MRLSQHIGHLGELAGHDHWVAGIGLGIAIGLGVLGWLGGRGDEEADAPEADAGPEEAPA